MAPPGKKSVSVELFDSNKNRSIFGVLTLETIRGTEENGRGNSSANDTLSIKEEADPQGAAMYVIVVILVYGLSIIFLIGSHVFYKRLHERSENDNERLVSKYLEEAPSLRERSARESFKKLKRSLVPVLAESNAKDLLLKSKNLSYLCLLEECNSSLLGKRLSTHGDGRASPPIYRESPRERESPARILPAITLQRSHPPGGARTTSSPSPKRAKRLRFATPPTPGESKAESPRRSRLPGIIITPQTPDEPMAYPDYLQFTRRNTAYPYHCVHPSVSERNHSTESESFDADSLNSGKGGDSAHKHPFHPVPTPRDDLRREHGWPTQITNPVKESGTSQDNSPWEKRKYINPSPGPDTFVKTASVVIPPTRSKVANAKIDMLRTG